VEGVRRCISDAGVSGVCTIVVGDLKQTLPEYLTTHPDEPISVLYVDCNAYAPALAGMRAAWDRILDGGVLCIDEHTVGGETKALKEFAVEVGREITFTKDKHGIPAFIVK
jgi:hypothetical protein